MFKRAIQNRRVSCLLATAVLAVLTSCSKPAETTAPQATVTPSATTDVSTNKPALPPLFDDIEKRTFNYFWETTPSKNGLSPDRFPSQPFSSIAAIGYALTAYPIGLEKGWITRDQAIDRTLTTLEFLYQIPEGPEATGKGTYKGFYYHFLDMETGARKADWVELSSVDTALMVMGVLFSQSYYEGNDPREVKIRELADKLYQRIDWTFLQERKPLVSMGWTPEKGTITHDWKGYNEAMMVYILGMGSPTHPLQPDAWKEWTKTYDKDWGTFEGQEYLSFAPQFGNQYSHVWIDFRGIQDDYMRGKNMDYFENSRRATLAQRQYAISNPKKWTGYGENIWGLTASDGAQVTKQVFAGEEREFRGYSARGAGISDHFDDGTIAPTAALGSLPFAPEVVIPAAEALHKERGDYIYSDYGFLDSFNPSFTFENVPLVTGKIIPNKGWVATDYIGIDQGPILTMIANYRSDFVWNVMKKNPYIRKGLEQAGFKGGWLEQQASTAEPAKEPAKQ